MVVLILLLGSSKYPKSASTHSSSTLERVTNKHAYITTNLLRGDVNRKIMCDNGRHLAN